METHPLLRKQTWKRHLFDCGEIVQCVWAGTPIGPLRLAVASKVQACAASLDVYNRTSLHRLRKEIACTRGRIKALGQSVSAGKLDHLLLQDEEYWCQRSRTSWLSNDNKNTKYFHYKANQQRKRNIFLGLFILMVCGKKAVMILKVWCMTTFLISLLLAFLRLRISVWSLIQWFQRSPLT
ncbi:hypothetical protein ACOSQ4_007594 [Xanthoceras sorbifolium]